MRVFVTGATGFIGSAIVKDLMRAGHTVLGLARSDEKAAELAAVGAEAHRGSLGDLESLKQGASRSDGVIHTAFNHDFSTYAANCEDDRHVIEALGAGLAGSTRPLVVTSGTAVVLNVAGQPSREDGAPVRSADVPRAASDEAVAALVATGVNASVVRLPQVHNTEMQGFVTYVVAAARDKGVSAYVGDGESRWPAAHVEDVARLYRLALEKAEPGAIYNAVAEEGIRLRDIAEVVGRRFALPIRSITPEEAEGHFGWLAPFAMRDMPASSDLTRHKLGWMPTGPGLLADLEAIRGA